MSNITLTAAVDKAVAQEIKSLKTKIRQLELRLKKRDILN